MSPVAGSGMLRRDLIGAWQRPRASHVRRASNCRSVNRRTRRMMVLGADMHKRSHTIAALAATTGQLKGDKTIRVGDDGFLALLGWARSLDCERVWALEDCRHVSGSFERFLICSGERVVRVATKLTADARRAGRDRGKSDRIDALAVARAALREGIDMLPSAQLAG